MCATGIKMELALRACLSYLRSGNGVNLCSREIEVNPHCGLVFASQKTTEHRSALRSVFGAFRYGVGHLRKWPMAH